MDLANQARFTGDQLRRTAQSNLGCERGGPIHKIDEVLSDLLGQYAAKYPELRVAVIETPASAW